MKGDRAEGLVTCYPSEVMDSSVSISLAEPGQTILISILFECVKINVLA